ncbi:MAG: CBS domain-containing protein [Sinobacteraceae bacterium]|nr:CBS domain-containing protein [Nevskiaceae bacterium]MCP5338561.1 CBS domain-containing protein [Nevskiaceae bacterium]MCP5466761.1 CBS domain-containing protein [Nevskiaceae bacterium]MCP5470562.1 CBS domain-containing protein [Nevskiaceae bacterium]
MPTAESLLSRKSGTLYAIGPDEPVLEAIRLMAERSIGAVLVMRGEELVGILSERDYARKVVLLGRSSSDTPVGQIMSSPVITVSPTESIDDCMRVMTERRIRHLPVSQDGRVIGILSIGDLVKAVIDQQRRTIEELEHYIHS